MEEDYEMLYVMRRASQAKRPEAEREAGASWQTRRASASSVSSGTASMP